MYQCDTFSGQYHKRSNVEIHVFHDRAQVRRLALFEVRDWLVNDVLSKIIVHNL